MVSAEAIAAIVFILLLSLFLLIERKRLKVQLILGPLIYFVMFKTKWGLDWMDKLAKKFPKTLRFLGYAGIIIGFLGMALISVSLIYTLFKVLIAKEAIAGVGIVLPIKAKGVFYVPFFYWIISIFIIATIHEFAHGVIARVNNLKVKSSGFAFLGIVLPILPAAFVEPDEEELKNASKKKQLMVFAAGPFANILLAFVVLGVMAFALNPTIDAMVDYDGIRIDNLQDGFPAELSGISAGEIVHQVNSQDVSTTNDFIDSLKDSKPGDVVEITTDADSYNITLIENPSNESKGYMGVFIAQNTKINEGFQETYGTWLPPTLLWIGGLLYWLYVLNLGIGLFNLLPLGPIDGGRMLQTALLHFMEEKKALKIWKYVSLFFLALILVNVGLGFI